MEREKGRLRKLVRECKRQYSPDELAAMSERITKPLAHYIIYKGAEKAGDAEERHGTATDCAEGSMRKDGFETILLYHSLPDEVGTHGLMRELLGAGKRVVLPTVVGDELELHLFTSEHLTHIGYQGIVESDGPLVDDYSQIDLAVIPGVAFTKHGDRLGRGRGYYDRLLPRLSCPLIGLAFPFQIFHELPCEPHDYRVDYVVS